MYVKDRRYLIPLNNPPYYAIKLVSAFDVTLGGISVNHRMEAQNHNGDTVAGLYAAGNDSGGWDSSTYDMLLSGHGFGFALNSGRIAGENAAKFVSDK